MSQNVALSHPPFLGSQDVTRDDILHMNPVESGV